MPADVVEAVVVVEVVDDDVVVDVVELVGSEVVLDTLPVEVDEENLSVVDVVVVL